MSYKMKRKFYCKRGDKSFIFKQKYELFLCNNNVLERSEVSCGQPKALMLETASFVS